MGRFIADIIHWIICAIVTSIFANAILSWLVMFDVVNMRNRFINQVAHFLDAVTQPVLRPVRRFIPPLGNIDISPVVVIVVLGRFEADILKPYLYPFLISILG